MISPPFQIPDEPEHVAYVKQLSEGRLPRGGGRFSPEELIALRDTKLQEVAEEPDLKTISRRAEAEKLQRDVERTNGLPDNATASAGVAASEPPLYYVLQLVPYTLGERGTLLDRIALMRLLSTLMAALTALFTFMFVRELLPRVPWAWTVAGLAIALVPLLGEMSGAVNPDSMLYAVTAAVFFCLARGFRRGLTRASALALGGVIAIGFMTKLNFVGLAPGAILGLVALSVRAARKLGVAAYANLALALTLALSPVMVYVVGHVVSGEPALGIVSRAGVGKHGSLVGELSYIWQLYLPRLPGMRNDFPGAFTTGQIWYAGYVGLYGWVDTPFPGWVYELALVPTSLIAILCVRGALTSTQTLRARAVEIAVYGAMCAGLMLLVGANSYLRFPSLDAEYGQVRYMLPLIPLLGVVVALAARGTGSRWGPAAGAVIVMLFLGHDVFSQLQEVARFYG